VLSDAALAHAREARDGGEPCTAQDLVDWYGIDLARAKRHVSYADNMPVDSDSESVLDDDEIELLMAAQDVGAPAAPVQVGVQPGPVLAGVDGGAGQAGDGHVAEPDGRDSDSESDDEDETPGFSAANQQFVERHPELWDVNGPRYAAGLAGYTRNCGPALVAAERTLVRNARIIRNGGDVAAVVGVPVEISAIPAAPGGLMRLGWLEQTLGGEAVQASYAEVETHMRGRQGVWGAVILREDDGPAHAVLVRWDRDSGLEFVDPHQGTIPDVEPHNVAGFLPLLRLGSPPMQGKRRMDPNLLVGAPTLRRALDRLTQRVRSDNSPEAGIAGTDDAVRTAVRSAADAGRPRTAAAPALGTRFGISEQRAHELIADVVRQDVRSAADAGRPRTADSVCMRYAVDSDQAAELIEDVVRADVLSAREPYWADGLAAKYGINRQQALDLIGDAAVSEVRAAADAGQPLTSRALSTKLRTDDWGPSGPMIARILLSEAMVADVRAAADAGRPLDARSLATRYGQNNPDASDFQLLEGVIDAAAASDARAAADAGKPFIRQDLARKYGLTDERAEQLISALAIAEIRSISDAGGSVTADGLARRFGRSRRWARQMITCEPYRLSGSPDHLPMERPITPVVPAGPDEFAARRAIRAAANEGWPWGADYVAERYNKSRQWALDQIDAAAHADVIEVLGRGDRYSVDALSAKYGMGRRWAQRQIVDTDRIERARQRVAEADLQEAVRRREPCSLDELAQRYGMGSRSAERAFETVVQAELGRYPFLSHVLATRYGRSRAWAFDQIDAHARRYVQEIGNGGRTPNETTLAERFDKPVEWARGVIRAAARDDIRRQVEQGLALDGDEAIRQYYGLSDEQVERLFAAVAADDARAAADNGVPYTADELAGKYARSPEWARGVIRAAARTDARLGTDGGRRNADVVAESRGITREAAESEIADDLARRFGISRAEAERQIAAAELADVRELRTGDKSFTGKELRAFTGIRDAAATGSPTTVDAVADKFGIVPEKVTELFEDAARAAVRRAVAAGRPLTPDALAKGYPTVADRAAELIRDVARADVREAAGRGRPLTADALAGKRGISRPEAFDLIDAAAQADVLDAAAAGRPHDLAGLAAKYGMNHEWAQDTIARAAVSHLRAADRQDNRNGVTDAVSTRFGVGENQTIGFIQAAVVAEFRTIADVGAWRYSGRYLVGKFGRDGWQDQWCGVAAAVLDVRVAAAAGRPLTPRDLAGRYGIDPSAAEDLIGVAVLAHVREVADGGGTCTVDDLADKFGMSRKQAYARIKAEPAWQRPRYLRIHALPPAKRIVPAGSEELRARAEVRAAADAGQPLTAERLAERYGRNAEWGLDQIDAAAHGDVVGAWGRGEHYDPDELAAKYGFNRQWAQRRISNAAAIEDARTGNAAGAARSAADRGFPFTIENLARAHEIGVEKAARQVAAAARENAIQSQFTAGGLGEKYRQSEEWGAEQLPAAARRFAHQLPDADALSRRFGISVGSARFAISAAARDAVRQRAGSRPMTAGDLARDFRIDIAQAEQEIRSVAADDVRDAAEHGVPYTAVELGERFGMSGRWGFDVIGAVLRADASGDRLDADGLAARYGVSRRAVEFRTGAGASFEYARDASPFGPAQTRELSARAARADVRSAVERGEPFTAAELGKAYELPEWCGADQIVSVACADVRDAVRHGEPYPVDDLVAKYGIGHDVAERVLVTAAFADAHAARDRGEPHAVELFDERYGVGSQTVARHLDAVIRADMRDAALRQEPRTEAEWAERYGVGPRRASQQIAAAAREYLADAAETSDPLAMSSLAARFGQDENWTRNFRRAAARTGIRARADRDTPFTENGVVSRYGVTSGEASALIDQVACAGVREAADHGRPYGQEALAEKYRITPQRAAGLIASVVRGEVRTAADHHLPIEVDALAERFGITPSAVRYEINAEARAYARESRCTPGELAARFGIDLTEATERVRDARNLPENSDSDEDDPDDNGPGLAGAPNGGPLGGPVDAPTDDEPADPDDPSDASSVLTDDPW
jgi:AraC-like DNA-binding protein